MTTSEYLYDKLETELTVKEYKQSGRWFITHINRIITDYPFLKIGAPIRFTIDGLEIVSKVKDFHINNCMVYGSSLLVDTGYGNVWYYETEEATEKEIQEYLED